TSAPFTWHSRPCSWVCGQDRLGRRRFPRFAALHRPSSPRPRAYLPAVKRSWGRALLKPGAAVAAALFTLSGPPSTAAPATAGPRLETAAPGRGPFSVGDDVELSVLSSRPDTVIGGTVLVRVTPGAATADPEAVHLAVDGTDVSNVLHPVTVDESTALEGLVTGLPEGTVEMVASALQGGAEARVELSNHPETGPVFSGPHQEPFVCDTADFELAGGGTLGPPLDKDCSAATVVQHVYRTGGGEWKPLPDASSVPSDATETTTSTGEIGRASRRERR